MVCQQISLSTTIESKRLHLFESDNTRRDLELDRIKVLLDRWLMSREEAKPDAMAIRNHARKLHQMIKSSSVFGLVLNFAGLNIWVDDRTSDGEVDMQEAINL